MKTINEFVFYFKYLIMLSELYLVNIGIIGYRLVVYVKATSFNVGSHKENPIFKCRKWHRTLNKQIVALEFNNPLLLQ